VVAELLDRQPAGVLAWLAAGVERVFLPQVLREGAVRVIPRAEVMELPPDLLAPVAGGVGGERELGIGLAGLGRLARIGGRGRMNLGYGDLLLNSVVTVATAGMVPTPRPYS